MGNVSEVALATSFRQETPLAQSKGICSPSVADIYLLLGMDTYLCKQLTVSIH
jgi:hypothetical protein